MAYFDQEQTKKIIDIAIKAGEIAVNYQFSEELIVKKKSDNSDVSIADLEVSKFIESELKKNFSNLAVICEENKTRQVDDVFFLIDPIDGTSSYIKGSDEFVINIALIKNNHPAFGLIYAPNFAGGRMIFTDFDDQVKLLNINENNEKTLPKRNSFFQNDLQSLTIITSPKTKDNDLENFVSQFYPNFEKNYNIKRVSSALKFILLAEGQADVYLHLRKSMEWDIAAGNAIINLINGEMKFINLENQKFTILDKVKYKKENFVNYSFFTYFKSLLN
jgi:3'(2'), 5'-bisphosphate nucleotidase